MTTVEIDDILYFVDYDNYKLYTFDESGSRNFDSKEAFYELVEAHTRRIKDINEVIKV
jgi:hypothetical protein